MSLDETTMSLDETTMSLDETVLCRWMRLYCVVG